MADVATIKYVYPPNWSGSTPDQPWVKYVDLLLMFTSSGATGETAVVKLRPEDWKLPGPGDQAIQATRLGIHSVIANVNKIDYVTIAWDRTPVEPALVLPMGWTEACFEEVGGLWDNSDGSDGTGNLILTSVGTADKGSYFIKLRVLLGV